MRGSALEGLRVLDLSRFIAGPLCAMQLGDFGADVVKIEKMGQGDDTRANHPQVGGESLYFQMFNRNKRSLALDFRNPDSQALLRRLVAEADVLVENFRPGTMEQMGCGWDVLSAVNPRLIMVRISGFGQDGPLSQRPCFDVIAQAMGGLMEMTGPADGPPTMAGTFIVDYATALYATIGTLTALNARHATGRGQLVEATLLDSAASLLMTAIPEQLLLNQPMTRRGNRDRYTAPVNSFRGRDGAWLHLSAGTDALFARFVAAAGLDRLAADPRFATLKQRLAHAEAIEAEVQAWVGTLDAADVIAAMDRAGVPCAAIATMAQVVTNPQLLARGQIIDVQHPTAGAVPTHGVTVRLSSTPGRIERASPLLGIDGAAVLQEWLRASPQDIDCWRQEQLIS